MNIGGSLTGKMEMLNICNGDSFSSSDPESEPRPSSISFIVILHHYF